MDKTLNIMTINQQNGIVRQVDLDRVKVTEANLETQKRNLVQALDVQKNLLKLQMGLNMNENIDIQIIDVQTMERETQVLPHINFSVEDLLPYQLMEEKKQLAMLQQCSAKYEALPSLTFGANYSLNFMSDQFFTVKLSTVFRYQCFH